MQCNECAFHPDYAGESFVSLFEIEITTNLMISKNILKKARGARVRLAVPY